MLRNATSGKLIAENVRFCESPFSRFKGLMLEKKENFNYALIFRLPRKGRLGASVHMLFVFFPVDIVYLDAKKAVVDMATLQPWMLNYTPKKSASYFIELHTGSSAMIKLGDKLEWTQ